MTAEVVSASGMQPQSQGCGNHTFGSNSKNEGRFAQGIVPTHSDFEEDGVSAIFWDSRFLVETNAAMSHSKA